MGVFQCYVFFYVRLRTYAQYVSMNEFMCSEHSVQVRIRRSRKRSTGNQPLLTAMVEELTSHHYVMGIDVQYERLNCIRFTRRAILQVLYMQLEYEYCINTDSIYDYPSKKQCLPCILEI